MNREHKITIGDLRGRVLEELEDSQTLTSSLNHIFSTPRKSMVRTLWYKLIDCVDRHTFRDIAIFFALLSFASLLSAAAYDNGKYLTLVTEWKGGAIPNTVLFFALTFSAPRLYRGVRDALLDTLARVGVEEVSDDDEVQPEDVEPISGIPVPELLDYLMRVQTFKRDAVEEKFKVARYKYTALVKKLKESGALVHGVNNQTMLNPEWSRARLAGVLTGEGEPVNIIRPLPSPTFTRRRISETPKETVEKPMCDREETECATACATA